MQGLRCLALLALALPARADVIVVDAAGGGSFTSLQAAVDAALDGDTLLVKGGSYAGFLVNQKSLQVVGDSGALVLISGSARVRSLPAGGFVLLANLKATGVPNAGSSSFGLWCSDNQGQVRIEGCQLTGATDPAYGADGSHAAWIELSPRVAIAHSQLSGGVGQAGDVDSGMGTSGDGARIASSTVAFYDCYVAGGTGAIGTFPMPYRPDGGHGGDGIHASASTLFLSFTHAQGGGGGDGNHQGAPLFSEGGNGGDGLELVASASARLLECPTQPGPGGSHWVNGQLTGFAPAGLSRRGPPSAFVDLPGLARHLYVPSPVRELTNPELTFVGQPGDQVYLWIGSAPQFLLALHALGMKLVQARIPHMTMFVGDIAPSGLPITTRVPWGDLGAGVDSALGFYQALFRDTSGQWRLGSFGTILVLDSQF